MDISKAKDLACELAGLLTVLNDNLCPAECTGNLMRVAEAKSAQLVKLLSTEPDADEIIDEMIDNAESEVIEKEEADESTAEEPTDNIIEESAESDDEEPAENIVEDPIEIFIGDSPDELLEETIDAPEEETIEESTEMPDEEPDANIAATDLNESVFMRTKVDSISKAFTINDKFRFKRELFGNSDPEFSNALDLISVMRSLDEAEDYFYSELGWDAENEDVKDFMRIVKVYFLNRQ